MNDSIKESEFENSVPSLSKQIEITSKALFCSSSSFFLILKIVLKLYITLRQIELGTKYFDKIINEEL